MPNQDGAASARIGDGLSGRHSRSPAGLSWRFTGFVSAQNQSGRKSPHRDIPPRQLFAEFSKRLPAHLWRRCRGRRRHRREYARGRRRSVLAPTSCRIVARPKRSFGEGECSSNPVWPLDCGIDSVSADNNRTSLAWARAWRRPLELTALFGLVLATRWPFRSPYLLNFDAANFALSVDEFNPSLHQPQPPGYPLFVALLKILHLFAGPPEALLPIAGILGSVAALAFLYALGDSMFGRPAGLIAAALLLVHPAFWSAGITNPVRTFLAAGSAAIAGACWTSLREPGRIQASLLPAGALAVASGFRPELLLFFLPLAFATIWTASRHRILPLAAGATAGVGIVIAWVWPMASQAGGVTPLLVDLLSYVGRRSSESMLLGAGVGDAGSQTLRALWWTLMPAASWAWVVVFVSAADVRDELRSKWRFLAAWMTPGLLFHCFVHVHHSDQTLSAAPALCLVGAWALTKAGQWRRWACCPSWASLALLVAAMCASTWIFVKPLAFAPRSSGYYKMVQWTERVTSATITAIEGVSSIGDVFVISPQGGVSYRQLAYYFPDLLVVALPTALGEPSSNARDVWLLRDRALQAAVPSREPILLPSNGIGVWAVPWANQLEPVLSHLPSAALRDSGIWTFHCRPGADLRVGSYRFRCRHSTEEDVGASLGKDGSRGNAASVTH